MRTCNRVTADASGSGEKAVACRGCRLATDTACLWRLSEWGEVANKRPPEILNHCAPAMRVSAARFAYTRRHSLSRTQIAVQSMSIAAPVEAIAALAGAMSIIKRNTRFK